VEIVDKLSAVLTANKQVEIVDKLEDIKMLVTLPQDLSATASPTFAGTTLSGLTPLRLVSTDEEGSLVSGETDITAAQLEELSDGSETILHSHAVVGATWNERGEVSSADYDETTLLENGSYNALDISGIVGAGHRLVLLGVRCQTGTAGASVRLRTNGQVGYWNRSELVSPAANVAFGGDMWVYTDASGVIEYWFTNQGWLQAEFVIRGWWE